MVQVSLPALVSSLTTYSGKRKDYMFRLDNKKIISERLLASHLGKSGIYVTPPHIHRQILNSPLVLFQV